MPLKGNQSPSNNGSSNLQGMDGNVQEQGCSSRTDSPTTPDTSSPWSVGGRDSGHDDDDDASRTTSAESSDDATETTDILCEAEYATVSVFFSPPIIEHFVRRDTQWQGRGMFGRPCRDSSEAGRWTRRKDTEPDRGV